MEVNMNSYYKKEKKWGSIIVIVLLLIILAVVSFYMLYIHVPYFNHTNTVALERNKIINKYKLNYDDYFNEYNSSKTYYIIRIKDKKKTVYQAYSTKYKLIDSYSGSVANKKNVINTINKEYKVNVNDLTIGYENGDFIYYGKYQDDSHLYYFYYSLSDGKFVKYYRL